MAWTYENNYNILPNLNVKSVFQDGVLKRYDVYPCDGYVLRIYSLDEYEMDENGNFVLDENGNKILITPYRSYGGATARLNYDWATNPKGFAAELYEDGMIIFGKDPSVEIM